MYNAKKKEKSFSVNNSIQAITLFDSLEAYLKDKHNSSIITSLFRYCLVDFGLCINSKKRLTKDEKTQGLTLCKNISLNEDNLTKLIVMQEKTLKNSCLSKFNERQQRFHLKKFIDFCYKSINLEVSEAQADCKKTHEFSGYNFISSRNKIMDKVQNFKKQTKGSEVVLSYDINLYPSEDKSNAIKLMEGIKEFEDWLYNGRRKPTVDNYVKCLARFLGWLYKEHGIALEELILENFIKVYDLNLNPNQFKSYTKYVEQKIKNEEKAKQEYLKMITLLECYFASRSITRSKSKDAYINALIRLTEYLYKDITDRIYNDNYQDIVIVQQFKRYKTSLPKSPRKIETVAFSWEDVLKVLLEFKRRADEYYYYQRNFSRKYTGKSKKTKVQVAKNISNFLSLSFLILTPPPRIGVVSRLQLGKTLKHGLFVNDVFVKREDLLDPSKAKYYIHLMPEDYKTGNIYGEWLGEFPNQRFFDGSCIYDYLNKYLYEGYRESIMKCKNPVFNHNYLFMVHQSKSKSNVCTGEPICQANSRMSPKIYAMFYSATGIGLYPHKLRTIFRTHLIDIGASKQELESAAFWMRHSEDIAKNAYTRQSLENKLRAGKDITSRVNDKLLTYRQID